MWQLLTAKKDSFDKVKSSLDQSVFLCDHDTMVRRENHQSLLETSPLELQSVGQKLHLL